MGITDYAIAYQSRSGNPRDPWLERDINDVIRREAAVARLQSDFGAAVSHEFRSPLTTVRQLSEMLEMGQVPSEERRQKSYQVLAGESRRVQRLVETLLNYGKMESGAQQYRFGVHMIQAVILASASPN